MIEIRQPELEALIMERLQAGAFQNVEEVLYQALKDAPLPPKAAPATLTSAEFLAAFRRSPFKEIDLEPESFIARISDPVEF
jgi:hypothetical protein